MVKIECEVAIEGVGVDGGGAEKLGDVEVGEGGEGGLEGVVEGVEEGEELGGEEVLEDC